MNIQIQKTADFKVQDVLRDESSFWERRHFFFQGISATL